MKILAVDDEPLALRDLQQALCEVSGLLEVSGFTSARKAMEAAGRESFDAAFLDIEMGTANGLSVAKKLKDLWPDIHIVFVTSYEKYAVAAFAIHATGYLMKPVKKEELLRELTFIYGQRRTEKRVRVQTFGGFEVYVDGEPLNFKRAKAKELLALLVDRKGASVTTREACAVLWEDGEYSTARKNYFQTILTELRGTLKAAGADQILIRKRNSLAVDTGLLDCDSYRFLEGEPEAVNSYRRDYMLCYSWAEFSVGEFEEYLSGGRR